MDRDFILSRLNKFWGRKTKNDNDNEKVILGCVEKLINDFKRLKNELLYMYSMPDFHSKINLERLFDRNI